MHKRIEELLKEARDEESDSTYIIVRAKSLQTLSNGLRGVIGDVGEIDNEALKEALGNIKAGLDWIIEHKSTSWSESEVNKVKADT